MGSSFLTGWGALPDWVSVLSPFVSAVAAAVSFYFSTRQHTLNVEHFRFENDTAIVSWAGRVLTLLSEAHEVANSKVDAKSDWYEKRRIMLLYGLSARADEGRFFFVNTGSKDGDEEKEGAFRGYRPAVIDRIVKAYDVVTAMPSPEAAADLLRLRREFVSEVQALVDPNRREWLYEQRPPR